MQPADQVANSATGSGLRTSRRNGRISSANPPLDYARRVDPTSAQKEWFSHAFLVGVAATAGYPVELTLNDVNGVDATVKDRGVTVEWQLKATSSPEYSKDGNFLHFDLDVRTYDLLTETRNTPGYLGVIVLPKDSIDWAHQTPERLKLRNGGHWLRITGLPQTTNTTTVRVQIPVGNVLSVDQVRQIMANERLRLVS